MKTCPKCSIEHSKQGTFCSRKCANSRIITDEHKSKTSATIRSKPCKNQFGEWNSKIKWDYAGPYTKIYLCTCKYSGQKFYSSTPKQVHPNLARTKKEYTYSCQFRFGIATYPQWFRDASKLIDEHGWYSTPGSRNGATNVNGISRDHLYSITDGWVNSIDPAIIRHPANCELIPHRENQSKHKRSKITLEDLMNRIKRFNDIYGYR